MKCENCIHYEENPKFDLRDDLTWYAKCNKDRDDIFESEIEGVLQVAWDYSINCSDYRSKNQ